MINWEEREELAKKTNDKKLLLSVYYHKHYMGDRPNKHSLGDCQRKYNKTLRELNDEERREYWRTKQRESRAKKK